MTEPGTIAPPVNPNPKDLKVPKDVLAKVTYLKNGAPRDPFAVAWFYRMLETGDATQSVKDVGWKGTQPSWKANQWKAQMGDLLGRAVADKLKWATPRAIRMLEHAVERAMDDSNKDSPQMLMVGVKAAEKILDYAKGTPGEEEEDSASSHDLIDQLVNAFGADFVRGIPFVMEYKDYRDYINEKYPLKEVGP